MCTRLDLSSDNWKQTINGMDIHVKTSNGNSFPPTSNFKLNPEAAVFLPSKTYLVEETQQSSLPITSSLSPSDEPRTVETTDVTNQNSPVAAVADQDDDDDAKEKEKAKRKAERKAQFEAERAVKLKQQSGNDFSAKENAKSKADLRAERRALQEAQRAAKTKSQTQNSMQSKENTVNKVVNETMKEVKTVKKVKQVAASRKTKKKSFFSHLCQYKCDKPLLETPPFARGDLHPAVLRLGLQYAAGSIWGSNARCIAFLYAIKEAIADYVTPSNKELCRDLGGKIDIQMKYLQECRPTSVSMENAVIFVKRQLAQVTDKTSDSESKSMLLRAIETYIVENIFIADETIAEFALEKIKDGDVILVYSHSTLVNAVLKRAFSKGVSFHVIIVDSRPKLEGIKTKTCLIRHGIECSYTVISAISSAMQKVTKVFLGAHALLANGYVMSRVGTAFVALTAKAYNVPVLVCCESHKFTDKAQIDSLVYNELGNPDDLIIKTNSNSNRLTNLKDSLYLDSVYLMYDIMPPELVSVVVTEIGMVPSTSVPVVLRIKR